jgi:WD repeat-containing protein 26
MGDHLDSITSTLSMFIEIGMAFGITTFYENNLNISGVPTIRFAQQHGATNLLNLSTVATFFSAVSATTLQFSYTNTNNPLGGAYITGKRCMVYQPHFK